MRGAMKRLVPCAAIGAAMLLAAPPAGAQGAATAVIDAADAAMGTATLSSVHYAGTGSSYFVGQAPHPGGPWLHYALTAYVADVDYTSSSMRQTLDRVQDDGGTPFGGAHAVWIVRGA